MNVWDEFRLKEKEDTHWPARDFAGVEFAYKHDNFKTSEGCDPFTANIRRNLLKGLNWFGGERILWKTDIAKVLKKRSY